MASLEHSPISTTHLPEMLSSPQPPALAAPMDPWTLGRVPVDRVCIDPRHPRQELGTESLQSLTASVRERGLLAPLRVRWDAAHDVWVVVCGARRLAAARAAGFTSVPCLLVEGDPGPSEILIEQLIENIQRENLDPIAQAKAFQQLIRINSWTASDVADAIHVHKGTVSRILALLELPAEVRENVAAGRLPATVGYELTKLPDEASQRELGEKLIEEPMPRSAVIELVRESRKADKPGAEVKGSSRTFQISGGGKVVVFGAPDLDRDEVVRLLRAALDEAIGAVLSTDTQTGPRLAIFDSADPNAA